MPLFLTELSPGYMNVLFCWFISYKDLLRGDFAYFVCFVQNSLNQIGIKYSNISLNKIFITSFSPRLEIVASVGAAKLEMRLE